MTVTHVWVARLSTFLTRPLPDRVAPLSQWETWVDVSDLPPSTENVERLVLVHSRTAACFGQPRVKTFLQPVYVPG